MTSPRARPLQFIRTVAMGGTASIGVSIAVTNVLRIVSSMVLTRLLDPSAYGVVGFITTVSVMLTMISDVGLQPFIVRHEEGNEARFLDQIWTIRLIRAVVLTIAMIALAEPAAALIGKPYLAPVLAVWSLSFLLDGLSSLAFATAVRTQMLWRLSIFELVSNVATTLLSIGLAIVLRNYWAMVIGMVCGQASKSLLSYTLFTGSRRTISISRERARELFAFARPIALSSIMSLIIIQSDKMVLARMLPLAAFGHYAIATTLAAAPEALANPYGQRILYPIYARIARENRPALLATFYNARRRMSFLYAFAVGGMIGSAQLIVTLLYDPNYAPVALFLALLGVRTFLRFPCIAANEVMLAIGRARALPATNVFRLAWLIIAGSIALYEGNVIAIVAVVAAIEIPPLIYYWVLLKQEGLLRMREEGYPFLIGLAGVAVGFGLAEVGLNFVH